MELYTTKKTVENEILNYVKTATDDHGNLIFKNHKFDALSYVYTIIRALAGAVYKFIDLNLVRVYKAIHPHTALEEDLADWLEAAGSSWKEATCAVHSIRIGSSAEQLFDIIIPQGLIVSTPGPDNNRIRFRITETLTLPAGIATDTRGFYTIAAKAECLHTGMIGNVVADAISIIVDGPSEIDIVYNPFETPLQSGTARETATQVRQRLQSLQYGSIAKFTPDWYESLAETHPNVARAIFKSSKQLGIPGLVKIFVQGRSGPLSETELAEVAALFDLPENHPGAASFVIVENLELIAINKIYRIRFADAYSIESQDSLDDVANQYFASLSEASTFDHNALKSLYLTRPYVVQVVCDPDSPVLITQGQVAVRGLSFQVTGEVYTP